MSRKILLWLLQELPRWVQQGWVTPEGAARIQSYYENRPTTDSPSLSRVLIVVFGFLLVALGIFLIFAGYWYSFSPNGRFDWLILLVVMVLVGIGVVLGITPPGSLYRDGAGLFYWLAMGFVIIVMGDTYCIGDSWGLYIALSAGLGMLMAYVLDSPYLMGIALLTGSFWGATNYAYVTWGGPPLAWGWFLLGAPYYWMVLRSSYQRGDAKLFLNWAAIIAIYISFFFTARQTNATLTMLYLTNVAVLTYIVGRLLTMGGLWTLPFRTLSIFGILYVVFSGTFMGTWTAVQEGGKWPVWDYALLALLFGVVAWFLRKLYVRKYYMDILVGCLPVMTGICAVLAAYGVSALGITILFDFYVLFAAAVVGLVGTWKREISPVNMAGLTVIAVVLGRFLDPDFTFMERGVSFLVVGIVIILANGIYMYTRTRRVKRIARRKGGSHET